MDYYKPARPPRVNAVVQCRWDEQYGRYLPQRLETTPGWRPIAEAPRDGTPILVFDPGNGENFDIIDVVFWRKRSGRFVWQSDDYHGPQQPTHFMPLPPAPEQP